ncbi:MAG TPA: YciI family protein [Candidatus Sumerlaeota bacterium]|nr:YciI family protein [Candidatus Sumerlaeota bacterium]HOR29665.1 YciI family protein [Candidatus Sumerlaeota bacterium]HPK01311.1 YciI family protein [Candidatus Sumerlaeota bacterium]
MLFVLHATDGPDGAERRNAHREAHVAYIAAQDAAGRIRFAGPLKDEAGKSNGALIIFEAEDPDAARAWVAGDPYVAGGVYSAWEVRAVVQAFPKLSVG